MSTENGSTPSGDSDGLHQPRARRPFNSQTERVLLDVIGPSGQHLGEHTPGGTPAPLDDAPPSVKATSAVRRELRRQTKRRMFPTVEYQHRLSHFNPRSEYTDFRGFYVLFWIGLGIMVIVSMLRSVRETGYPLQWTQWPLFVENIWELAASDLVMVASTAVNMPLHRLYNETWRWLLWEKGGMTVQSLVQAVWLYAWIAWPFARNWTWTAQVFFTLHTLTLFMKMHSWAFYCGHLSTMYRRLRQLDLPVGPEISKMVAVHYPRTMQPENAASDAASQDQGYVETQHPGDSRSSIVQLREDLAMELTSPEGNVSYPSNLSLTNFADYLLCPTLCYELEYPRAATRSYMELFYKVLAVFGCVFLLTVTSEEFILPVLDESRERLARVHASPQGSRQDSALIFAETVSRMLFPFMVTFLLVFLVIFEYVLGAFAEITRFADRGFFGAWWNSLDWLEFSREWNKPVHHFFRRHVYSASRGMKLNRPAATAITFFVSALAHELVMGCITRKFRGYGFSLMMLQMPLVMVQKLPFIRRRSLLNNIMFWICMILGLSLLCALYVLV